MAEVAVTKDGRVHMVDDAGAPVSVEKASVKEALAAGFRLESAESVERRNIEREYGDISSQVATAAEGALEGATLGLGTAGLAAIMGDDYRADALARREVNPTAHVAGQVAGSVAPILASGGTGAVARGASLVGAPVRGAAALGNIAERGVASGVRAIMGEGAVGQVAARAAGVGAAGAVEGAAYGLGSSIADVALENTDWTAERALSAMSDGAWYGFKGGAAIGGVTGALGAAGKRAVQAMTEGQTFKQAVTEFSEKRAVKSLIGNNAKHYNELTDFGQDFTRAKRIGRKIIEQDIPTDDLGKSIGALKGKTDEAAARMRAVATELDDAGVMVNAKNVLSQVDAQIADLRKVGLGSHNKVAAAIEREIAPLRKAAAPREAPTLVRRAGERAKVEFAERPGKEFSFSEWWKLRQRLDDSLNWAKRGGDPATDNLRKLRATVDQGLDDAIARHTDDQAKRLVVEGTNAPEAQQATGLGASWKKAKEDYGDFVFLREAAEDQAVRAEKNRWISPSDYGTGAAFALGTALLSQDPNALESLVQGAAVSMGHKFLRERGAGWIAKAADSIAKSEARMNAAAKKLAGGASIARTATRALGARENNEERSKRFDDVMRHVDQFQRDPEYAQAQVERIVAPIVREQPEVASKMAMQYQGDIAYLASKAPRGTSAGTKGFQPLKSQRHFSRVEKDTFARIAEALADPTTAIDDIAEGRIDPDVIEALRERRPLVYEDLRFKVMQECASLEDQMPFYRRNFLSAVFDFEGDPSLEGARLAALQAPAAPSEQQPAPQPGAKLNPEALTDDSALPSQKAGI